MIQNYGIIKNVMESFKIFSETTHLNATKFHMNVLWMNFYQTPSSNFYLQDKIFSLYGMNYNRILQIIFSETALLIATKFHMNVLWVLFYQISSGNFDPLKNMSFVSRAHFRSIANNEILKKRSSSLKVQAGFQPSFI